ncbi:MAG: porin, partial [Planctomycetota bacterium]
MILTLLLMQGQALAPTDFTDLLPGDPGEKTIHIGGRFMEDYSFFSGGELTESALGTTFKDGAEVRRARIRVFGDLSENIAYKMEYDWAGGTAFLKDAYLKFSVDEIGDVLVGHQYEPLGMNTTTSSRYITFIERSTLSEAFMPERNMGISLWNSSDAWTVSGGLFRDTNSQGKTADQGWGATARAVYRPVFEDHGRSLVHLGVGASYRQSDGTAQFRARPESHLLPRFVDTGALAADQVSIINVEAAFQEGPFHGMFEYTMADLTDNVGGVEPSLSGMSIQGGWFLTGENRGYSTGHGVWGRVKPRTLALHDGDEGSGAWEVALRYSNLDLTEAVTVGNEL